MDSWTSSFLEHLSFLEHASVDDLEALYRQHGPEADFTEELLRLLPDHPALQNPLTWLLKHHLEHGEAFSPEETQTWLQTGVSLREWPARLHFLQTLPGLSLQPEHLDLLMPWLDQQIQRPNKFVRAWAYHGMALATKLQPELLPEIKERFLLALEEEAPSVQARIRRAIIEHKLDLS